VAKGWAGAFKYNEKQIHALKKFLCKARYPFHWYLVTVAQLFYGNGIEIIPEHEKHGKMTL